MAYQPSQKRKREEEDIELNITPIMNLMVVLIPLLLSAAQLTELSLLEYLPPAESATAEDAGAPAEEPKGGGKTDKLSLLVNIAEEGIQVSMFQTVEEGKFFYEIPKKVDGSYNWETLNDSLWSIKQNIVGEPIGTEKVQDEITGEMKEVPKYKFKDGEEVSITAMGVTPFQIIVEAMDKCKYRVENKEIKPMFPVAMLKQFQ